MSDNRTENKTERKIPVIEVNEHEVFDPLMSVQLITSIDLCSKINGMMKALFKDFQASSIMCNDGSAYREAIANNYMNPVVVTGMNADGLVYDVPIGNLYLNLFFNPARNGNATIKAVDEISHNSSDMMSRLNRVYGGSARSYKLTQDAIDLLTPYMANPQNPNLDRHVYEIVEPASHSAIYDTYVKIVGINLDKIVTLMYGNKTDDDKPIDYMCSFSNFAMVDKASGPIISVAAAERKSAQELAIKLNLGGVRPTGFVSI